MSTSINNNTKAKNTNIGWQQSKGLQITYKLFSAAPRVVHLSPLRIALLLMLTAALLVWTVASTYFFVTKVNPLSLLTKKAVTTTSTVARTAKSQGPASVVSRPVAQQQIGVLDQAAVNMQPLPHAQPVQENLSNPVAANSSIPVAAPIAPAVNNEPVAQAPHVPNVAAAQAAKPEVAAAEPPAAAAARSAGKDGAQMKTELESMDLSFSSDPLTPAEGGLMRLEELSHITKKQTLQLNFVLVNTDSTSRRKGYLHAVATWRTKQNRLIYTSYPYTVSVDANGNLASGKGSTFAFKYYINKTVKLRAPKTKSHMLLEQVKIITADEQGKTIANFVVTPE